MSTFAQALAFLAEHWDLVEAIFKAITSGASKESIKQAIERAEVEGSDAVMREELGLPPR